MNDCITKASPLLPGARREPVGTPSGIIETSSEKFGMKRAGNSRPAMFALGAKFCALAER